MQSCLGRCGPGVLASARIPRVETSLLDATALDGPLGALSDVLGAPPGSNRQAIVGVGRIAVESRKPSVNQASTPASSILISVVAYICRDTLTTSIPGQRNTRTTPPPLSRPSVPWVLATRKVPPGDQATRSTDSPQNDRQPSPREPAPTIRPPSRVATQIAIGSTIIVAIAARRRGHRRSRVLMLAPGRLRTRVCVARDGIRCTWALRSSRTDATLDR
jgi:hypothetical protein